MAISGVHYRLLKEHRDILPQGGSLLEIGEANWYGDVEPDFPHGKEADEFAIAKAFYRAMFAPSRIVSVDLGGQNALRLDLNAPVNLTQRYDLCINHGTAEHVFNIAQVFKTMHDWTKAGGIMIHESPMLGWIDHGFYTLQPTLFYDVAAANEYEIVSVSLTEIKSGWIQRLESRESILGLKIPLNSMLFVVFRKRGETAFRVPMQGYYDGKLSKNGNEAWGTMR